MSLKVTCPRCGQPAEYSEENPYRPFCSKRCKESDLYRWLVEDEGKKAEDTEDPEPDPSLLH